MIIILLGAPGAGKGTYAAQLSKLFNLPHISTGDLVRDEIQSRSAVGNQVREYSEKGSLVPDNLITDILKYRIIKNDCKNGFILDGFPRTVRQAELLQDIISVDVVINIVVPDDIIIDRLSSRLTCQNCGAIYNAKYLKPKRDMICDICNGPLYQRKDDISSIIQNRLDVYKKETAPLINHYDKQGILKQFHAQNPKASPDEAVKEIMKMLPDVNSYKEHTS